MTIETIKSQSKTIVANMMRLGLVSVKPPPPPHPSTKRYATPEESAEAERIRVKARDYKRTEMRRAKLERERQMIERQRDSAPRPITISQAIQARLKGCKRERRWWRENEGRVEIANGYLTREPMRLGLMADLLGCPASTACAVMFRLRDNGDECMEKRGCKNGGEWWVWKSNTSTKQGANAKP